MSSEMERTAIDALKEVIEASEDRTPPEEIEARLRRLVRERSGVKLNFFWDEETKTGDGSYDALLRFGAEGAISIGWCPDRGIPWSLRGASRWRDLDVLMVNEERLSISSAVEQLDFLWEQPGFAAWLVDYCLIRQALREDEQAFEPSDEELQAAMDNFRRRRGLSKAEQTTRWMELHGMTQRSLEKLVDGQARATKLRRRVIAGREESVPVRRRAS
jgi:putative peptide maturation system protein